MTYPYNSVYNAYSNNQFRPNYYGPQPYMQQPFMQQPIQQPMQQQPITPVELPIQSIKFLTADQIKAYIVLPNTKEMLIDKANNLAYIRSANQMGESQTSTYKFEELTAEGTSVSPEPEKKPEINLEDYVKKDDTKDFVKTDVLTDYVKKLEIKLAELEKQVKVKNILGDKEYGRGESINS